MVEGIQVSKSRDLLIIWSHGKWKKAYISTSTISMATKHGTEITYRWKIPPSKSHPQMKNLITAFPSEIGRVLTWRLKDPTHQVMWLFDQVVKWKIKKLLSAFQQHLLQPNFAEQCLRVGDTISQAMWTFNQAITWSLFVRCF